MEMFILKVNSLNCILQQNINLVVSARAYQTWKGDERCLKEACLLPVNIRDAQICKEERIQHFGIGVFVLSSLFWNN